MTYARLQPLFALAASRRLAAAGAIAATLVALAPPLVGRADAQQPFQIDLFGARKELPNDPLFGGISIAAYEGIVGVRFNGALHVAHHDDSHDARAEHCSRYQCSIDYTSSASSGPHVGAWSTDIDLVIAPFRPWHVPKALLLGFSPYVFGGFGQIAIQPEAGGDSTIPTLSFGAGVTHELVGWLGVAAEARQRRSMGSDSALAIGGHRSWEYRLGVTFSFGGPDQRRGPIVTTTSPAVPLHPGIRSTETYEIVNLRSEASAARVASRVLDLADGYVDTRFRMGGATPHTGFDGAGFVRYVYGREGITLPRTARRMARVGAAVPATVGRVRAGDLLFFASGGTTIDHVAIYVGRDRIIHASSSGGGVRYDVLGEGERGKWFASHLVAARRVANSLSSRQWILVDDDGEPDAPDRAPAPPPSPLTWQR